MNEILVQVLWRVNRKSFVADQFKLIAPRSDRTITHCEARDHLRKSEVYPQRELYDFRIFTADGSKQLDNFGGSDSLEIWESLHAK